MLRFAQNDIYFVLSGVTVAPEKTPDCASGVFLETFA